MKRLVSLVLSVMMVLSLLPQNIVFAENAATSESASASGGGGGGVVTPDHPEWEIDTAFAAEENFGYQVNEGEVEIVGYIGTESKIIFPETLAGYPVTSISGRVGWNENLTKITIPGSVKIIQIGTFSGTNINEIIIENGVENIEVGAFSNCEKLTSITIPESVTNIGNSAFSGCENLRDVTIMDAKTSIGVYSFEGCRSLVNIELGDNLSSIDVYAFAGCASLENVTLPAGTEKITGYAFCGCSSLKKINVDEDNSHYSSDDGVLFSKDKTEIICYPAGKQEKTYVIPNSVTNIGDSAFYQCEKLVSITIPESVTSIGEYAFGDCGELVNVFYSGTSERWRQINISAGNDDLIKAMKACRTNMAYVLCAEQYYNAMTEKFYAEFALITEGGLVNVMTTEDVVNYRGDSVLKDDYVGSISKPGSMYPSGSFLRYAINKNGFLFAIDNDGLLRADISTSLNYNDFAVADGLYLVNVRNRRGGVLYFFETDAAVDPQNGEIATLDLCEDGYEVIAICDGEYNGNTLTNIPSRQTEELVPGVGNAVIAVDGGKIVRIFSFCEGYNIETGEKDEEKVYVFVASGNEESGTVTGDGAYLVGAAVTVTATADEEYIFSGWYVGDEKVSEDAEYTFTAEEDIALTAKFTKKTTTTTGGGGGLSAGGDKSTAGADSLGNTDKEEITAPEETPVVTPIAPAGGFGDLGNHAWAADAITKLVEQGIIKGTSATTYSPANNIIRADFAALIVRMFNLTSANEENFDDVAATDYFASELAIARNTNVVNGIGNNKFAPRGNIRRQDMMVMIYRAMTTLGVELEPAGESYAADFDAVSDYAKEAVSVLMANGIINGKNGKVDPMASATRAEVAVMFSRVLDLIK